MQDRFTKDLEKIVKDNKGLHNPLFHGKEKKYLIDCIESGYVSSVGKYVTKFEKNISRYVGCKYAVATNSGTSALHLILKYFKINQDHEVLMPSLTYVATANAVAYCNATPNFVEIDEKTLGVCPIKLEKYLNKICILKKSFSINKNTGKKIKALIVVHLYGFPCKIIEIKRICKKFKIILIEDAAEAVGSFYKKKHLGTFGDAGVLSFNGNKPITCGSGGMILSNNKGLAEKTFHLSVHAKKKDSFDHVHDEVGFNYRMNNLSAAVGCAQLEKINNIMKLKRNNFIKYRNIFRKRDYLEIIKEPENSKSNYWLILGKVKNSRVKKRLLKKMRGSGLIGRTIWRPLHSLKIFKKSPKDNLKISEQIFLNYISFPSSPSISL